MSENPSLHFDIACTRNFVSFATYDNFGTRLGRCYHEHIFRITKNCVIEENTEEHNCQRNELLSLTGWRNDGFHLAQDSTLLGRFFLLAFDAVSQL